MITVRYLNFINEGAETTTALSNLFTNISKVNNPLKEKKSKILKEISTTKTADDQVIEEGGIYYTFFDSVTLKNGDKVKQIKVSAPFNKGYLTYTIASSTSTEQNKIYGYLIVKDKAKLDILKGVELLKYHEKILQKGGEPIAAKTPTEPKTEVKPEVKAEVKPEIKKNVAPVKTDVKAEVKPEVKKEAPVKPEATNKPI